MTRNPKGTVGIESVGGRLRLRLPRQLGLRRRYYALGLTDTKANRRIARAKAQAIESDIVMERFDPTLEKYRSPSYAPTPAGTKTLLEIWNDYAAYKAQMLSETTVGTDFRKTRNHLLALPTQDLAQSRKIRDALLARLSPDAARRVLMQIKAACSWAIGEGLIESNPFLNLPQIKVVKHRSINPFSRSERDMIIEGFAKSQYYAYYTPFVKFLFWTGCRTSEAVGLRWKHVDTSLEFIAFEEALVGKVRKETKTHSVRRFPINQSLRELLAIARNEAGNPQPDAPVFPSREGLTIDPHNFLNRAWRSVLGNLPISYRPQYNTRHTFITLCLEEGVPVVQVAHWVGNSPKTIWQHYAGITNLIQVPEP